MNTLTAFRTSLPPKLEFFTPMPTFKGSLGEMQTAATICADHPFGRSDRPFSKEDHLFRLEQHEIPFDSTNINVGRLAFDFTNDQLLPNLSPDEAKRLVADFYNLIQAMGSLIVVKHGPGTNPDILDLLNGN